MQKIKITYKQEILEIDKGTTYYEVTEKLKLQNVLAAQVGYEVYPLDAKITESSTISFLDVTSLAGYKIYQAALKFLFYVAVSELYPDAEVTFLHSVPKGILSEIRMPHNLTAEEISKIKGHMASIVEKKERFYKYRLDNQDAFHYFKNHGEEEKAYNVQNVAKEVITVYRLRNHINYFYTMMPYDTGVINRFELVFLGRNRIVLVCPNVTSGNHIPEYVHYENIVANFMASKKWLRKMQVPYLSQMNNLVSTSKIEDFIHSNEIVYQEDLLTACEKIISLRDVKLVLIAGPSSSGKTTTMKRLSAILRSHGYDPIGLSTDDFFVNRKDTPKNEKGEYDYECIQAIDLELFNQTLQALLNKEEVELPEYDFVNGEKQFKGKKACLKENSILLIEGLHCLNDDLIPYIDAKYKFKIYLSPFIPLNVDRHNYISTLDLRLIRRIVRDNRTRGKKVDQTIAEWQIVRSGEEKYIFPYVYQADMIINTALAYEVGVLKIYAIPLLFSVGVDSEYYSESRRLVDYLQVFFTIPSEYVPKDSVLREFIG